MALMKGSSQSDVFTPALVPGPVSSSGRTTTTTTPAPAAGSFSAREQQRERQLGLEEEYYRDEGVGHGARFRRCERLLQDGERVEALDFRTYDSLELGQGGGDRSGVLLEHEGSLMDIGGGGGEEDEDFSAAGPQGDEFDYMPRAVGHDGTEHEGFGQFGQVDDRLDEAGGASNLPVATEEPEREAWIPQGIVTSNFPMGSDGDSIFDEAIRDLMNNSSQAAAVGEYCDTAGEVDIDGLDDDDPHELQTAPEAPDGMDFTIEDVEGGVSAHEEVVGLRQDVAGGRTTEFDSRGMDAASSLPDQALFVTEEDAQFLQAEDEIISESRLTTTERSISGQINCADSPGKYTVEEAVAADGADCGQRPYWPTTFEQELYASLPQQDAEFLLAAAEQCPDSPEISDGEPHQTEGTFLDPLENEGSSKNGHSFSSEECKDDSNPQNEGTSDRDETLDEGGDAVVAGQESDEDGNVGLDDQGESGRGNSPPPSEKDGLESKGGARVPHPALQHTSSAGCARTTAAEVPRGQPDRTQKQHSGNCVRQSSDARTFASSQDLAKGKTAIEPPNEGEGGPLWVKWRGKWEAAIRCSVLDCPPSTLKAKPNYSKKKHVVVYFPSARLFSWVDTQHTCPIGESPAPLLAGTHFSQREAVKDDNLPRKRMLIKLGGEILDISDRLHIKAVVPFAQDVKVWKTFAKEAAAATTYSELGELLVRLHLTIAPVYIKPRWMDQRYASWKEDCAKSASAANLQKLTRELINNVRWEDVTPLWNAPEQPELDPEWEHWKGDVFDEKDSDDDSDARPRSRAPRDHSPIGAQLGAGSGSKRFKEQARARRQSQLSPDTPDTPQKRLKINSVSPEVQFSGGPGSSSFGHATTAFRSPLVHLSPLVQGKGSDGPVASNSGLCTAFLKRKNRRCNRPQKEDITYCGKHKHLADPENRGKELESEGGLAWESGLCSASLGQQFTRCENPTSEGSIFCQTHIHLGTVQSADTNDGDVDFSASSSKEDRCHGITTRGIQCTHKPKDGSPFCVKHSTQQDDEIEGRIPFQGSEGSASKRARIPNDIAKTNGPLVQVQVSRAGSHHGIPGIHGNGLMQRSNDGNDDVTRKRKWVSGFFNKRSAHNVKSPLSQGQQSNHLPKVTDGRASNVPRCKGRTTRDGEQCSFSVRPGHLLCTKHLMAAERGKKIAEGDSKTSSVSNAKALFESFLKSAEDMSSEGPNGLVAKKQLLKFTRAEAAQDYCTAEELLKLVTLEMSKIEPILRPAQAGVHETKSAMKSVLPVLINGNVQGFHVPGTTQKVSREQATSETCGLCGLSVVSKEGLGRHWKDSHRKEVILFVKGYACRACNQLYSRKHTVRRHWRKCHQSLPVRSPDWMAVCSTCNSRFDHHDTLLQHVCTAHPDKLSSPALKTVALENRVGSPVADEAAETLACDDCHEEFNTHWDLFHHKESVHRTLNNDVVGTKLQSSGDTKPGDRKHSSSASQSVPEFVVCRNCGKKFPSVSELGRHADAEHSIPPNLPGSPPPAAGPSGKSGLSSESCRLKLQVRRKSDEKVSGSWQPAGLGRRRSKKKGKLLKQPEKNPEIEKDALLKKMKTAVQTAQLRNLRQMKRAEAPAARPRKALYSLTKGGQMLPFDGDSKSDNFPDDMELLGMAQSACCQSKLLTSLQKKGVKNPDQILARVSQVRTNANVKLEWLADGYLCPSGCKEPKHTAESVDCEPLMTGKVHETKVNERDVGARRDYPSNSDQLDIKPTAVIISADLSNGQEPVPVVCSVDQDVVDSWRRTHRDETSSSESFRPDSFNYITKRFLNPSLCLDPESFKLGCSCLGQQCSPESCEHVDFFDNDNLDALDIYGQPMKGRFPYDKQGCIILEEGYIAYECNSKCHCQQACQNRVLQKGVTVKLEVFRTLQKGWAVRAAQRIPRGTFVCEYLGEVLRDEEAQRRGERYDQVGCSYLYDIDAHLDTSRRARRTKPFVIDATKHGNVARFINHSCSPNLVNYQVLVETMDYQMAHIGLFASRDIESGEELAYDYRYKLLPGKGCPCHCGAPNCRGRLY